MLVLVLFFELLVVALWCLGIRVATGEGMIFEKLDDFLERVLPSFLYKPTIGCVYCMASIHGALIHIAFWYLFGVPLGWMLISCVCSIAFNGIIAEIYALIRNKAEMAERKLNGE